MGPRTTGASTSTYDGRTDGCTERCTDGSAEHVPADANLPPGPDALPPQSAPGDTPDTTDDNTRSTPAGLAESSATAPPGAGGRQAIDGAPGSREFAEALLMLARLPLSDAERTEAVRRLLAERDDVGVDRR